jgi:hypothetical protein
MLNMPSDILTRFIAFLEHSLSKCKTTRYALLAGLASALLFIALGSVELTAQGLYYDEVHQAPAALYQVGKVPYRFGPLAVSGIPLLTMPYSSAMKSNLYGLWMKLTASPFSIVSWRLFGLCIVSAGLLLFCVLVWGRMEAFGLAIFLALFLTDVSVLLLSRHDFGPVALALSLRLLWAGIWVREEANGEASSAGSFFLGFIPALCLYEKLSNVVFFGPLLILLVVSRRERLSLRVMPALLGFLLGMVPLIFVNILTGGISFSASSHMSTAPFTLSLLFAPLAKFLFEFVSMGDGQQAVKFFLGVEPSRAVSFLEFISLGLFLGLSAFASGARGRGIVFRGFRLSLLFYLSSAAMVFFALPTYRAATGWSMGTWIHHWVAATPFQYLACAFAVSAIKGLYSGNPGPKSGSKGKQVLSALAVASLICLLSVRIWCVWDAERALHMRRASSAWDPSYTRIAQYAVAHQRDGLFIAADWGFGMQIYCLSNGSLTVIEPFWAGWNPDTLKDYLAGQPHLPIYVLTRKIDEPLRPEATTGILATISYLTGQRLLPVEEEISNLRAVTVRKFPPLPDP